MLQSIIQFVRANELPINMMVGVLGFALFNVGDILRSRNAKIQLSEEASVERKAAAKRDKLPLALNIAGAVLLIAACLAFYAGGYYAAIFN